MHPYLTADIPGIGGVIKESPEDFVVDEIPSYLPCGSGEHCYLTIEKRGITTLEAIHRIARQLKVAERDIGYAGMKDAVGVTRQTISIQHLATEKAQGLELDGVAVIAAQRHSNKLKVGHLKGNHFCINVRDVSADAPHVASKILDMLALRGVPNFFGFQRYGAQGNSHLIGAAMLKGEWQNAVERLIGEPEAVRDPQWAAAIAAFINGDLEEALHLLPRHCRGERDVLQRLAARPEQYEKAFAAIHPRIRKLYLSAAQSFLFDQVVAHRINHLDELMTGDLAIKHINGACFLVEDAAVEQERASVFEISPSGPMFGSKMKQPAGAVWELERGILAQAGIELTQFDQSGGLRLEGERRPLRVPVTDLSWSCVGTVLTVEFTLPKGSYATSLLRELLKTY
jgi:tRNA pseudouridine13 synthase